MNTDTIRNPASPPPASAEAPDTFDLELERTILERQKLEVELERLNSEMDVPQTAAADEASAAGTVALSFKTVCLSCAVCALITAAAGFIIGLDTGLSRRPPPTHILIDKEFVRAISPQSIPQEKNPAPEWIPLSPTPPQPLILTR